MNWKAFTTAYLTFSKNDRIAVLLFVVAFLALYGAPRMLPKAAPNAVQEDTTLSRLLQTATEQAQNEENNKPENDISAFTYEVSKNSDFAEGALFAFDPNTLPAEGWKKLGLRDRTVKTLLNYRNKGGHFYKHEDLKKIWGLPDGFYERVKDYIQIADTKKEYTANTNPSASSGQAFFKTPYAKTERKIAVVDVNAADTAALIALPGIGSKLAQRIVAFRNKLGGFYTTEQIRETYGLPDSTFEMLKPYLQVHGDLKKFNLNTATKDELKTHPYIKWALANAIVEYRNQHGLFKNLDELKNIMLVDAETYSKIAPYLSL